MGDLRWEAVRLEVMQYSVSFRRVLSFANVAGIKYPLRYVEHAARR